MSVASSTLARPTRPRLLVSCAALLWGLQFAFLNPALALLLVALFHASAGAVGGLLALYNVSGLAAAIVLPAYADRHGDYLRPLLFCGLLTLALVALLALTTSLAVALVGLLVLGGPAGVGSALLFAHLKDAGATPNQMLRTRAIISFAWVAGPPLAALIIAGLGQHAILAAIGAVAALNLATTGAMLAARRADRVAPRRPSAGRRADEPVSRSAVALLVAIFIALQATNNAAVSIMTVFVTHTLRLNVLWAGIALGVAAAIEIPALVLIGPLRRHHSSLRILGAGCVAGIAFYAGMTIVSGPAALLGLQLLNACFFAVVAGVGLTLFQAVIARPGLANGMFTNTQRVGAIISGPLISFGSVAGLGYRGTYLVSAVLVVVALGAVGVLARGARRAP